MKNLTWQNPEQLFVAQELINKVKSKCCGIKDNQKDKEEIIKRKTYGVSNVKSFVSDMDIILCSSIEKELDIELFTITLKFKLIKNESSNNRK